MARKLLFLCLIFFAASLSFADSLVGEDAPEIFVNEWVTNNPPQLDQLDGKVYAVEFWATWCSPCVKNIPHLNEINDRYSKDGLVLIALSSDRDSDKVKKLVKEKNIRYNVAMDKGTIDWYKVRYYPTAFVINSKGKITFEGFPWNEDFENAIVKALK